MVMNVLVVDDNRMHQVIALAWLPPPQIAPA